MHRIIVLLGAFGLPAGLLSACTPLTEQQAFERQSRLIEARDDYAARTAYCKKIGGRMEVQRRTPLEKPGYLDYVSARCTRR